MIKALPRFGVPWEGRYTTMMGETMDIDYYIEGLWSGLLEEE